MELQGRFDIRVYRGTLETITLTLGTSLWDPRLLNIDLLEIANLDRMLLRFSFEDGGTSQ